MSYCTCPYCMGGMEDLPEDEREYLMAELRAGSWQTQDLERMRSDADFSLPSFDPDM